MTVSYIVFNGQKSTDFGLFIDKDIGYNSTFYDVEQVVVPGRDGVLLKDKHRLRPAERSFSLLHRPVGHKHDATEAISAWLTVKGWHRLELSWDPAHYYLASVVAGFDIEEILKNFGKMKLNLLIHPIKYKKVGEVSILLSNGGKLLNPGNVIAKPKLIISGNGSGVININGRTLSLENVQREIIVDSERGLVYADELSAWDKVLRTATHSMPSFDVGENLISWTGGYTIRCVPNWGAKI